MTGLEKERNLVAALRRFFEIETDDQLDRKYCIDAVIVRPRPDLNFVETPFFPAPILVQLTWNAGNWYKRMAAMEKIKGTRHHQMAFIEVRSEEITPLMALGLFVAIMNLWLNTGTPKYALIEVTDDGNYKISDLQKSWDQLVERLNTELFNQEFEGRLVFWKFDHGFIKAKIPDVTGRLETVTFYCDERSIQDASLTKLLANAETIAGKQHWVLFSNSGSSPRGFRGLANNVRLKP